jgi:glutathione-regulated potassium-efflux system ancillary protein KefC
MDPLWIALAFAFGFLAKQARLPPLVGYLAAGFILHLLGIEGGAVIEEVSDLGVLLLLFGIGLKLRPKRLLKPEVWAGTTLHMGITVVLFGGVIYGLTAAGFSLFGSLESLEWLLLAFMLSFSSTVFAVKVLEEKGEVSSLHGRVAIGVLIMQDIVAILFMTFSTGEFPSPWALSLLGLVLVRPVLMAILNRAGHGELLLLFGLLLTVGGAVLFEVVGLKADLGALVLGVIVASHPKAEELSNSILGLKDLLLVGFFLSIGLIGVPDLRGLGIASLLVLALPLKVLLFFLLFTRFRLRARTSTLSALGLANYSEFGLIVGSLALSKGWIGEEWLVIFALALALSFAAAAPLNRASHALYARYSQRLRRFETRTPHPQDDVLDIGATEILIFGMGKIGTGAYDTMQNKHGGIVLGLDYDPKVVARHDAAGRCVLRDDATDPDFWEKIRPGNARMVLLCMSDHPSNLYAAKRLKACSFPGRVAAVAEHDDQAAELREAGVDAAYNIYAEAGAGFAGHVCGVLGDTEECLLTRAKAPSPEG